MNRFPPRRILVAADLSAPSFSAIEAARDLALRWNSSLEIVYVRPSAPAGWNGAGLPELPRLHEDDLPRRLREKLLGASDGFPRARLTLSVARGRPDASIADLARPDRTDLLVMGTHAYAGLDRLLLGSTSESVIRRAHVPVLAVPAGAHVAGVSRVLAPWNATPYATRGLRWAREFSRGFGATLDVLRIREDSAPTTKEWPLLRRRLEPVLGTGTDWTVRLCAGDARERIVEEANGGRYGLVVLSAHLRPTAGDIALGSTVERTLRGSRVAILAVPSGSRARSIRRLVARAGSLLY
jgi:nucleotide-binding universal stress UspA family protein